MRFIVDAPIMANELVAPGHMRLRLKAPEIGNAAQPGQFCMLAVTEGLYPFLRRPMSFEQIHDDGVSILYKIEGEGTALLAKMSTGQTCSIQGPLGNGFPIDTAYDRHIIVGGGIGIAPFPALARALKASLGKAPEVIVAARNKDMLIDAELFEEMGCVVHLATDDGSAGEKAFAADMLRTLEPDKNSRVYACGPMIMMETTAFAAFACGANCLVSLEARMACGDGACLGCVVESTSEREGEKMVRVCVDGPVFDAKDIDWKAHNYKDDL